MADYVNNNKLLSTTLIGLWAELVLLYGCIPLILFVFPEPRWLIHLTLWIMVIYTLAQMMRSHDVTWHGLWHGTSDKSSKLNPLLELALFASLTIVAATFTLIHVPERFLAFPSNRPIVWTIVMILYPLLSALPQEIVFRSFFFWRYQRIFPSPGLMITANVILFTWSHIMFRNWLALLICAVGGVIFARAYKKTSSLYQLAALHALYGNMIFTVGLGVYFFLKPPS